MKHAVVGVAKKKETYTQNTNGMLEEKGPPVVIAAARNMSPMLNLMPIWVESHMVKFGFYLLDIFFIG